MSESQAAPATVGRHRLIRKLGEGGMGVVWAAHDPQLDRSVAIKMIRPRGVGSGSRGPEDTQARARLMREARSAASVSHPNICPIYEVGEESGELFVVMELLEGEPLSERIARGPLPLGEAAEIILGVLSALETLHRRGLVHRDLKPTNVFLTPHGVKLLDFGLARSTDVDLMQTQDLQATLPGQLMGTPRYMAPEQWAGGEVSAATDLFAVGALLYEMLAGRPAYHGSTMIEVYHAVTHERPAALTGGPAVKAMNRAIQRALARHASDRYADAAAMARDIREALLLLDTGETPRVQTLKRLIVLPFRLLRADPEIDFLSFSLPDAITVSLSGIDGLVVRSSMAASRFAGETPDLARIATEAEVDVVLSGTLLRAGDQVRVSCQLVEAPGGTLVWSKTAQVALGDLFQLQDDLAGQIVASVATPLAGAQAPARKDVPANARAFELFLRANELARDSSQWIAARDVYRECVEADSGFAPAWARYARVCRVIAKYGMEDYEAHIRIAGQAFQRAFALNPDLSIAHNLYTPFEVEELAGTLHAIERLLTRAKARANDPELYAGLVLALRFGGLMEASVAADRTARSLDPVVLTSVEYTHFMTGDYASALTSYREAANFMGPACAMMMMGREEEAIALLREMQKLRPDSSILQAYTRSMTAALRMDRDGVLEGTRAIKTSRFRDPEGIYFVGRSLARVGFGDEALATLNRAVEGGFYALSAFAGDPWLDPIRGHAEFRALVSRVEAKRREAIDVYERCGGEKLLGVRAR